MYIYPVSFLIALIAIVILAAYILPGYLTAGGSAVPDVPAGETVPSELPTEITLPVPTTLQEAVTTATIVPLPVKVPPTFRITPTPTQVQGIVSYPHIVSDSSRGLITKNYTVLFEDSLVFINGSVEAAVYNGAKNGERAVLMDREGIEREDWGPGYFRAFVDDFHQDAFYADLLSSFRKIRAEMALTDNEYVELMTVFVQSMEYDSAGASTIDSGNRFPVETFIDGKGVCGDKSMLLAALLSREGYDVALFVFDPEKHMGVGIRSSEGTYRNTSYAYIETTRLSFIGIVPDELTGGITLSSMPYVVPIGNGYKGYSATPVTRYIDARQQEAEEGVRALEAALNALPSDNLRYNQLVSEHNQYVEIYNYINSHRHDRAGTYAYISTHGKTSLTAPVAVDASSGTQHVYARCSDATEPGCPAGSKCCSLDNTCYAWCTHGVWVSDLCVCRI